MSPCARGRCRGRLPWHCGSAPHRPCQRSTLQAGRGAGRCGGKTREENEQHNSGTPAGRHALQCSRQRVLALVVAGEAWLLLGRAGREENSPVPAFSNGLKGLTVSRRPPTACTMGTAAAAGHGAAAGSAEIVSARAMLFPGRGKGTETAALRHAAHIVLEQKNTAVRAPASACQTGGHHARHNRESTTRDIPQQTAPVP